MYKRQLTLTAWDKLPPADAVVLAVAHQDYVKMPLDQLVSKVKPRGCVIDVKSVLDRGALQAKGLYFWRL